MFDYMIKILPNGRLLVRNSQSKTSETIKASEISDYFQNVLKEQLEAENEKAANIEQVRERAFFGDKK